MVRRRAARFAIFVLLACACVAPGLDTALAAQETAQAAASTPPPAPAPAVPVDGSVAPRAFDAEAATEAYLAQLSPEARAKSDRYFEGGYWLILWDLVAGFAVAWIFLGTNLSVRLRDRVEAMTRTRWLQSALYAMAYIFLSSLILLPWSAYTGYFREHQYGMSNHTLGAWLGDQAKSLGIGIVLGSLALTAIYAVLRRAPRTWWLWGAVVMMVFAMLTIAIAPVYLEPVFNDFKPLADGTLKSRILALARANEIPATDVFEYDASRQTKRISAHVSGLFGTTRISMNDNLMKRSSEEAILAVLGHEMGHYVLNHVTKSLAFLGILIVAGFGFVRWAFEKMRPRFAARWGLRGVDDVAGLPLLMVLLSVFFFLLTPVSNTITRTMEHEADNYGLNASREPDGFSQAAVQLSEYRKLRPGPIEEFVFYDHPSGWNRVHRSMVWKAEHIADPDIVAYDAAHRPPGSTAPETR